MKTTTKFTLAKNIIPIAVVLMTAIGCKKNDELPLPQQPPPQLDDVRTVLLKEVIAQSLPNPYFQFTYDGLHYVQQISFAAGIYIYNVEYSNKRVRKLTNIMSATIDSIVYSYRNGLVTEMNEFSGPTSSKRSSYHFSYNATKQLTQVNWFRILSNGDSDTIKKAVFTYQDNSNLTAVDYYYGSAAGILEWSSRWKFSDYDNKVNVDDFRLLKQDFFEHFLFLPQVKLQKNNPRKVEITTIENDFELLTAYEYRDSLPVKAITDHKQTRGEGAGRILQYTNEYTYY